MKNRTKFLIPNSLFLIILLLLVAMVGCTMPWRQGDFKVGLPRPVEKFDKGRTFFVAKTERRVKTAFEKALRKNGFTVVDKESECECIIRVEMIKWEYNDKGFLGSGPRDDMYFKVNLVNAKTHQIEGRVNIQIHSDFGVIEKYVETL